MRAILVLAIMASLYDMLGGNAIASPVSRPATPIGPTPLSPHGRSAEEEAAAIKAFNAFIAQQQRIGDMVKRKPWDECLKALPERPDLIDDRRRQVDVQAVP